MPKWSIGVGHCESVINMAKGFGHWIGMPVDMLEMIKSGAQYLCQHWLVSG